MSYEFLILALLLLVFCFLTMILTLKVVLSVINSARPEGVEKIKVFDKTEKKPKKTEYELWAEEQERKKRERYETVMRNLETYDGTEIGQEEVK